MPLFALALPNDLHLVVQQTLQPTNAQQPQILEPQVLTPNNPNVVKNQGGGTSAGTKPYRLFFEGYFDAGISDLIGSFTTQVLRYGARAGQHDVHVFARNETLDTRSGNLPYQSNFTGFSVGAGYRYWFPGNKIFGTVQAATILSGPNQDKTDLRMGFAGFDGSSSDKWFNDIYGDFFYVDLAKDVVASVRLRNGLILDRHKDSSLLGYVVGQAFGSGKGLSGTENRIEGGFGVGYVYKGMISANLELRAGYAYRGAINERAYLNPQFIISGGF